jgi:hypothetical protein
MFPLIKQNDVNIQTYDHILSLFPLTNNGRVMFNIGDFRVKLAIMLKWVMIDFLSSNKINRYILHGFGVLGGDTFFINVKCIAGILGMPPSRALEQLLLLHNCIVQPLNPERVKIPKKDTMLVEEPPELSNPFQERNAWPFVHPDWWIMVLVETNILQTPIISVFPEAVETWPLLTIGSVHPKREKMESKIPAMKYTMFDSRERIPEFYTAYEYDTNICKLLELIPDMDNFFRSEMAPGYPENYLIVTGIMKISQEEWLVNPNIVRLTWPNATFSCFGGWLNQERNFWRGWQPIQLTIWEHIQFNVSSLWMKLRASLWDDEIDMMPMCTRPAPLSRMVRMWKELEDEALQLANTTGAPGRPPYIPPVVTNMFNGKDFPQIE